MELRSKYRLWLWSLLGLSIDACAGFSGRCCRLVFGPSVQKEIYWNSPRVFDTGRGQG